MSTYQRKHTLVEARQHEGAKIVVNSNLKGNQGAIAGDYLVTDPEATQPKGSVYVVPKADFEKDHELVPAKEERNAGRGTLPDYVSHKEVSAAKITGIVDKEDGALAFQLEGLELPWFVPSDDLKNKPQPQVGWYLVVYNDGYVSFSPAQAFEEGYTAK